MRTLVALFVLALPVFAQMVPDSFQPPRSYAAKNYQLVPLGPDVAHAKCLEVNRAAMLLDQEDSAWQPSCRNLVLEEIGQELQFFRRRRLGRLNGRAAIRERQEPGNHRDVARTFQPTKHQPCFGFVLIKANMLHGQFGRVSAYDNNFRRCSDHHRNEFDRRG